MREHGVGLRPLVLPHLLEMAQRAINVATGKPEVHRPYCYTVHLSLPGPVYVAQLSDQLCCLVLFSRTIISNLGCAWMIQC